jgi:tetratricopeptide (TPR) repeat protein
MKRSRAPAAEAAKPATIPEGKGSGINRTALLLGALALAIVVWGGLRLRDSAREQWIASASVDQLEAAAKTHPDEADVLARLGTQLLESGNTARAEPLLSRALELDPSSDRRWTEHSKSILGDREAIEHLNQGLKAIPDSPAILAEIARRELAAGDGQRARDTAATATTASPSSPEAWTAYAEVMAAFHRQDDAVTAFRRALGLRDTAEARLALARTLVPLQRYDEVIELCSPLTVARPPVAVSKRQRALALTYSSGARLNGPVTAAEMNAILVQLQEAQGLTSELDRGAQFLPSYFLGQCLLRLGRAREAIPPLERCVALGPQFPGGFYALARAYRVAGHADRAEAARHAELSRALVALEGLNSRLEQHPDDPEALLQTARSLTEIGERSQAADIYRQLIATGRLTKQAQSGLDALSAQR